MKKTFSMLMTACCLMTAVLFTSCFSPNGHSKHYTPDMMAEHYELHKQQMEELRNYLHHALKDSCVIEVEFEGDSLRQFYIGNRYGSSNYFYKEARAHQDSMMSVVGLTRQSFNDIQQKLKSMGCIGVRYNQYHPDEIVILFQRNDMGCYRYLIWTYPMTAEEIANAIDFPLHIPYNDYCIFDYDGSMGAFDTGGWNESEKKQFLKKIQQQKK